LEPLSKVHICHTGPYVYHARRGHQPGKWEGGTPTNSVQGGIYTQGVRGAVYQEGYLARVVY